MKKKFTILILTFLLTGCNVEYNLDIDKSLNLDENIIISASNADDIIDIKSFNYFIPIDKINDDYSVYEEKSDNIEYYNSKKSKDNKELHFSYNYDIEKFNYNTLISSCYEYVTAMKSEDNLILSTSKEFLCFDKYDNLDDVTVTITSKYKLNETNADIIEKHKYTWNITKDNANNKYFYLSLDTTVEDLTFFEKLMRGDYFNIFTVSVLLFIIGLIIYLGIKRRGDRINKV